MLDRFLSLNHSRTIYELEGSPALPLELMEPTRKGGMVAAYKSHCRNWDKSQYP
jgi:hypothetical protein